ncbi:hypothetical protein [Roseivirga pacifica]
MNPELKNPKTYGISFTYWNECLIKLLSERNIQPVPDHSKLAELYHDDYSPMEVYYSLRTKRIKSANLTLHWFDDFGREEVQFTNNEQIRHFYKQNPNVKAVMEAKKKF